METKVKKYTPRVERGMTKLYIPYNNKEIIFLYPAVGPQTYQEVGKEILGKGQKVPHGDFSASLAYAAYCMPDIEREPEIQHIRKIIKGQWLWVYNNNGWTDKGVYVVQDEKAEGRSKPLYCKDLEKRLRDGKEIDGVRFSADGTVRFAPKETYQLGEHTSESFAKDGFVRASVGSEGAEKLAEVSTKFKDNPMTWGLDIEERQDPEMRVSVLADYGGWLGLGGGFGGGSGGCAFRVSP